MISFTLTRLAAVLAAFSYVSRVVSVPFNSTTFGGLDDQARDIVARATPAAPHFVIYSDAPVSGETGPPPVSQVEVRTYPFPCICFIPNFHHHSGL